MFGISKKENNIFLILHSYVKEMKEKVKEERAEEKEKNEQLEPTKREQLKLFKITFSIIFIVFVISLLICSSGKMSLIVFASQALIALISFILFKCKINIFGYYTVFLMPCVAFGCTIFLIVILFLFEPSSSKKVENNINTNTEISNEEV